MRSTEPAKVAKIASISREKGADVESLPSPVDVHVGARIRQRRTVLGMSQEKLGDALRLTFQQVQKYERGTNRVSASRLYDLCRVFKVSPDYFFDGLPNFGVASPAYASRRIASPVFAAAEDEAAALIDEPPPLAPDEAELLASFSGITDPDIRRRVLDLVKSISTTPG